MFCAFIADGDCSFWDWCISFTPDIPRVDEGVFRSPVSKLVGGFEEVPRVE